MASRSTTDPAATSFSWRLANTLAIASPYLVAAALYLGLYLSRAPAPPSPEIAAPPPAPASANGSSVTAETETASTPAAPAEHPQAAQRESPAARARHSPAAARAAAHPAGGSPAPAPDEPVHVDPALAGTMKLSGAPPDYPAVARDARIQGTVVLDVIIGPSGFVQDVSVLSGPPLLQAATVDTIRAWHYRPWLAYGKAVPFETQVSIDFRIDAAAK